MADGSRFNINLKNIINGFRNSASPTAIALLIILVALLLLSFWEPLLLGIVGSLIVASVAFYNADIQRYNDYIKSEVEKAQALNEFQIYLTEVISQLEGTRFSYSKLFGGDDNEHLKHTRAFKIPYMSYVPNLEQSPLLKTLAKLSFASNIISEEQAENITNQDLSIKAKSLTVLAFNISSMPALRELWVRHNELYQKCNRSPDQEDYLLESFNFETLNDVQTFHNYMIVTDRCLTLTDNVLNYSQAALDYFIPAAKLTIDPRALEICPVPTLLHKAQNLEFLFTELGKEEKDKLENLPNTIDIR